MEQHFSPESLPEFLYPEKESEKNHNIIYLDKPLINGLQLKFKGWFHSNKNISKFAMSAEKEDVKLILFAIQPGEKSNYKKLWTSLFTHIDEAGKKSENPCFIIDEKVPGILLNSSSKEEAKKIAKSVLDGFKLENMEEAISGISYFPCLDYQRENLVENSLKALVHASMLEDEKLAVFDSISLNVSSDEFFQKKDIENAIKELELAILLNSRDCNVLNSLGVCHAAKKDFENAAKYFEKAAGISNEIIMPMYNLGLVYYLNDEKEKSKAILEKIIKDSENHFEFPFYLGKIEYDSCNFDMALEYFFKAESIKSDNAPVLNYIGEIYLKRDDLDLAFKYYKKALKVFPQNAYALSALGFIYFKRGENQDIAETFMKQSTEIEPTSKLFRDRLNLILKDKKEVKEKKARLKQA